MMQVEDDSLTSDDIAETGYRDESGEMRRPWCPATRILEHRESQAQEAEAESRRKAQQQSYCNPDDIKTQLREDFPAIQVSFISMNSDSTSTLAALESNRGKMNSARCKLPSPFIACVSAVP